MTVPALPSEDRRPPQSRPGSAEPAVRHDPFAPPPDDPDPQAAPPRNRWKAPVIGAVAVVVTVAVITVVVIAGEAADHKPAYRLAVPKSLVGGAYTLTHDLSADRDAQLVGHRDTLAYRDLHARSGLYSSGRSAQRPGIITFDGLEGTVYDPDRTRGLYVDSLATKDGSVLVPAETIRPPGAREPLTCEVVDIANPATPSKEAVPVCVWTDQDTIGIVYDNYYTPVPADSIDLGSYAAEVAVIRDEVRAKAG